MMDGKTIVASIVVGILGLISTVVGLLLEVLPFKTQVRLFYFTTYDECIYFRSPAFFLVVAAIVCLIVALVILSITADCGCGRAANSSSSTRALAILAFVFCWLICLTAIVLFLLAGATYYGVPIFKFKVEGDTLSDPSSWTVNDGNCYRVRRGVFGATAALSFIGITLGIISCIALVSEDYRNKRRNQVTRATSSEI